MLAMQSKFWMHYHKIRLAAEVAGTMGAALLVSYLILKAPW
jgi:hypothetical protein